MMQSRNIIIGLCFISIWISCHPKTAPLVATQNDNLYLSDSTIAMDSQIATFIKPYRDSLRDKMDRVVTILPQKITHSRNNPESRIGPWLCDILLFEGLEAFKNDSIDGALYNPGGIRTPQLKDTVTVRDIYELLPFDNTLVLLELKGHLVQKWIDHTVKRGGWPMSHTLQVYVSGGGENRALIKGRPIQKDKIYQFLTNDYVAGGGDQCGFLVNSSVAETDVFIRDIIINHFDKGHQPQIPTQVRIHFMTQN